MNHPTFPKDSPPSAVQLLGSAAVRARMLQLTPGSTFAAAASKSDMHLPPTVGIQWLDASLRDMVSRLAASSGTAAPSQFGPRAIPGSDIGLPDRDKEEIECGEGVELHQCPIRSASPSLPPPPPRPRVEFTAEQAQKINCIPLQWKGIPLQWDHQTAIRLQSDSNQTAIR